MKGDERRTAREDYKARKVEAGIYAVRCAASNQCWVGRAPDLATIRNRIWFTLRLGGNPHSALQSAWHEHGESSFAFEVVDTLRPEESPALRDLMLKKRLAHWRETLAAEAI